ncbi:hypothetical protein [Pontibacter sp. H249]|uniref:hypothetical protein n=1 Tax=Pontibacter sp. H249 TaxID=3133420 RepID=UPI0030BE8E53
MYDSDKKKVAGEEQPKYNKPANHLYQLKPNEAYEPGFGKYTLTESQIRTGEINGSKVKQFTSETKKSYKTSTGENANNQPGTSQAITSYNGSGISHYPNATSKTEESSKMREDNTNMHNNW